MKRPLGTAAGIALIAGNRQVVDNAARALRCADNLVFHHDTLLRTIAPGASELSLDPPSVRAAG